MEINSKTESSSSSSCIDYSLDGEHEYTEISFETGNEEEGNAKESAEEEEYVRKMVITPKESGTDTWELDNKTVPEVAPQGRRTYQRANGESSSIATYDDEEVEGEAPSIVLELPEEKEFWKPSIFVHSSPSQFPDIMWAQKSAFGSIFVRADVGKGYGSTVSRKPGAESQFNMIPSFLDSYGSASGDSEKRSGTRGSVYRAFEKRGMGKEFSGSSSSQWDVFPITKSALFSFNVQDRVHQTRNVSKIEERIMTTPTQTLKFAHSWPTGSTWTGHWDGLGMAGIGTYVMPHEVTYIGKMQDGVCHDDETTLIYPNGFRALHCNYVKGKLTDYQFQFPDALDFDKESWQYCRYPDRRFWSEIQNGLKASKMAQKTQEEPPKRIPANHYDTNDGFYNPKTKMLVGADGELLRVPTKAEEDWIMSKCRKGFPHFTGFCPELYEDLYDNDQELIQNVKEMQKRYKSGVITHDELYRFYSQNNLTPSFSSYRRLKMNLQAGDGAPAKSAQCGESFTGHPIQDTSISSTRKDKPMKRSKTDGSEKEVPQKKFSSKISPAKTPDHVKLKMSEAVKSASSSRTNPSIGNESRTSSIGKRTLKNDMKEIITNIMDVALLEERERHRDRFVKTQSLDNLSFGYRDGREKCVKVLKELYNSIEEKEEFCDSIPSLTCDLKELSRDRFHWVKYWGTRIFTLDFPEDDDI